MCEIIFLGNSRCYHTMDWYRSAKHACYPKKVFLVTELIESEGHVKLIKDSDDVISLFIVDALLFRSQSRFGNIWRNFIRFILLPYQVYFLKKIVKDNSNAVYHAHTMYYMLLAYFSGVRFIGTPQGSEILVRPERSLVYRFFATKALRAAKHITVDSIGMKNKIRELCGVESHVVQNGIDVSSILNITKNFTARTKILSIRGFTSLYRIDEICAARNNSTQKVPLTFLYPFWWDDYKSSVVKQFQENDTDLGRLPRDEMYILMASALLAISIPESDSSPRSVYEAIFCGCCVAVTYSQWIDALPDCMKSRLCIVDLEDEAWFDKAISMAKSVTSEPYVPSDIALNMFDQSRSMKLICENIYFS